MFIRICDLISRKKYRCIYHPWGYSAPEKKCTEKSFYTLSNITPILSDKIKIFSQSFSSKPRLYCAWDGSLIAQMWMCPIVMAYTIFYKNNFIRTFMLKFAPTSYWGWVLVAIWNMFFIIYSHSRNTTAIHKKFQILYRFLVKRQCRYLSTKILGGRGFLPRAFLPGAFLPGKFYQEYFYREPFTVSTTLVNIGC